MKSLDTDALASRPAIDPVLIGTACCMAAALIYATANLCLRWLSVCSNPLWAVCVKETVSVAVVGPWLLVLYFRGVSVLPRGRALLTLMLAGVVTELGGNLASLWSMGQVGLAITVPVIVGASLISTAVLGRVWLGERVTFRSTLAIGILILSVVILSCGAGRSSSPAASATNTPPWLTQLAVAGAAFAGCCYSFLNTSIRRSVTSDVRPSAVVLVITSMGTLTLAPLSFWQLGWQGVIATPSNVFGMMILAGVLNLVAFASYSSGLRFTTAVHANMINASQTALAALGGWLVFHEPLNATILSGLVLTIAGVALIDRPVSEEAVVADV